MRTELGKSGLTLATKFDFLNSRFREFEFSSLKSVHNKIGKNVFEKMDKDNFSNGDI